VGKYSIMCCDNQEMVEPNVDEREQAIGFPLVLPMCMVYQDNNGGSYWIKQWT
jgi:hypothetical protein